MLATLALVALVAPRGLAGEDDDPLQPLLDAIDARVDALDEIATPTKAQKRERKQLDRAGDFAEEYDGGSLPQDLRLLTRAASAVFRAKTADEDVLATVGLIRDRIDEVGLTARQDGAIEIVLLAKAKPEKALGKRLEKTDLRRDDGLARWPDNFGKGAKLLSRVASMYRKIHNKARKTVLKEAKKWKNDLVVDDAFITSGSIQIGHPVDVTMILQVERLTPELTVTVRAMSKADVDAQTSSVQDPDAEIIQTVLGEFTLEDVESGTHVDSRSFTVPKVWLDPDGQPYELPDASARDCYLVVEVDPHSRVMELLEEDSEDNNVFIKEDTPYFFDDTQINTANVVLEELIIDPPVIFVDTDGTPAAEFGVEITVSTTGNPAPIVNTSVVVGVGIHELFPFGEGGEKTYISGSIWNPLTKMYESSYFLPPLVAGEPLKIHLDIRFDPPWAAGEGVIDIDVGEYLADFILNVNPPVAEYEPNGPDNSATISDGNYIVLPLTDCDESEFYGKRLGNSDIGSGVSLSSAIDITADETLFAADSDAEAGAIATVDGGIDVSLMGFELDLVGFQTVLERDPIQEYSYLGIDLLFLDFVIFGLSIDTPLLESLPVLPDGVEICDGGFCYTKDFDTSKDVKKSSYFFPGGVPVSVTGKVEGKVGFTMGCTATNSLTLFGGPFVELLAGVDLALGICPVSCVGAGGELTLVKDTFLTTVGAGMTVVDGIDALDEPARSIDTSLCFSVVNKIEMLNGRLFVFAEFPWCDWCWAAFVPYPCACGFLRAELDIIAWDPFIFCQTLVDWSEPICCVAVTGLPICTGDSTTVCVPEGCEEEGL